MDALLPWSRMLEVIDPVYPKAGKERRPYPLDTMLRIHCMQQWYSLRDGAMEDVLYEIPSMRLFTKLSLDQAIPERTTNINFRHQLELHQLVRQLFDATIIETPNSTKNKRGERDPEMHQTKKAHQWYFGMRAHIGVDAISGLTHSMSMETTPANEHDLNQVGHLLHGEEEFVFSDAGDLGAENRDELADVKVEL